MSATKVQPIPEGFHALTPHLVCKDAVRAIEFYKQAFGAEEQFRLTGPDGALIHASLRVGDSMLLLTDECPPMGAFGPQKLGGSPVTIHLSVADADASVARAVAAGAKSTMPVTEMFWGARYGVLQDPFGHSWSVATQVKNLSPEEIRAGLQAAMRDPVAKAG
ncbi:MAG TPA: VOC family protein [Steroidobacteraceae bacterium]|nr:VOC family protein [Steroidobacteraceae bacterium]